MPEALISRFASSTSLGRDLGRLICAGTDAVLLRLRPRFRAAAASVSSRFICASLISSKSSISRKLPQHYKLQGLRLCQVTTRARQFGVSASLESCRNKRVSRIGVGIPAEETSRKEPGPLA